MSQSKYDFIIVGGSVAGLLMALTLTRVEANVCIIEKNVKRTPSLEKQDIRVVALNHASIQVLKNLGCWELIKSTRPSPYQGMEVWDGVADGRITFDANETVEAHLGYVVEHQVLIKVLQDCLANHTNIEFKHGQQITAVDLAQGRVWLNHDVCLQADLLIGADGANSLIRNQSDIQVKLYNYNQKAIIANLHCEKSHHELAYQCFQSSGPVALLPLQNPHHVSLVWSLDSGTADEVLALDAWAFEKRLNVALDGRLGKLKLISEKAAFPLQRQHAKAYWYQKSVLIGDAAHVIHPLAGQGLNLGFMDVATLFDAIVSWQKCDQVNLSRFLNCYQRQRRAHVSMLQATMDGFYFGFQSRKTSLIGLRNWGLNAINRTPKIKNMLMNVALGKIGFTIPYLGRNHHGRKTRTSEANPIFQ